MAKDLDRDFSMYNLSKNFTYIENHRTEDDLKRLMRRGYLGFYLKPRVIAGFFKIGLRNPRILPELGKGLATAFVNLALAPLAAK